MRKDRMKTKEYSAGSTVLTVAFVLICLVWIMPIYEVVVNSLKSNNAINLDVFALPNSESFVGFANYVKGMTFGNYPFLKSVGYSLFISVVSTALILLCCLFLPREGLTVPRQETLPDKRRTAVYGVLFCVAVAMVLRGIPYWLGLLVIVMALLVLDRRALLGVDWGLLVTFAAFFTFSGNMARIEPVRELFRKLLTHGAMPVAALTSQVISNVPAAILLSRFTDDYRGLLVGVNIGGAGTLVASLASLITFREYTKHVKGQTGRFMVLFSAISFGFLGVLLVAMTLWMR